PSRAPPRSFFSNSSRQPADSAQPAYQSEDLLRRISSANRPDHRGLLSHFGPPLPLFAYTTAKPPTFRARRMPSDHAFAVTAAPPLASTLRTPAARQGPAPLTPTPRALVLLAKERS